MKPDVLMACYQRSSGALSGSRPGGVLCEDCVPAPDDIDTKPYKRGETATEEPSLIQ